MKNVFKNVIVATSIASTLAGCSSPSLIRSTDDAVANSPSSTQVVNSLLKPVVKGDSTQIEARALQHQAGQVVRTTRSPWIGGGFIPTTNEDGLPAFFREVFDLNFGDGKISLATVAARLTKITGVPVRVRPDVYPVLTSTANKAPTTTQVAAQMRPTVVPAISNSIDSLPHQSVSSPDAITVDGVGMQWHGKLRDFLDHLTNTLALSWEYRDGSVVIMRLVTQSYTVAVNRGKQSFSSDSNGTAGGSSGGAGGSTQSSKASAGYTEAGETDAFASVVDAVKSIVASTPGSLVVQNSQVGSLIVTTSKETQAQVRDYLTAENKKFRQNVNVTFDIYSVRLSDSDSQGINWSLVFQSLGQFGVNVTSPASLASLAAGGVTYTKLGGDMSSSSLMLNALHQNGNAVQHKPISLTAQNGKLKTQQSSTTEGYIKSTTPGTASAAGGAASFGLNADTLTTGDSYTVMPIVQSDNSVLLKYSFKISDLVSITNFSSGAGATQQTVQIPKTTSVSDGSDVILAPGEVLMITGLSRVVSSSNKNRLADGAPMFLGGSDNKSMVREQFVVLLRATPL